MKPDTCVISFLLCLILPFSEEQKLVSCINCSSDIDGVSNTRCPYNGNIVYDDQAVMMCPGFCYARTDVERNLTVRGCASQLQGMPPIMPPTGCYDWQGAIFCICSTPLCNLHKIGPSSGKSLDYVGHEIMNSTSTPTAVATTTAATTATTKAATTATTEQKVVLCMNCSSDIDGVSNTRCPYNGNIVYDDQAVMKCPGFCYSRTVAEQSLTVRGCTSQLQGMPPIMPPAGCYDWQGATFCICSTPLCNLNKIGPSSGQSLDYVGKQTTIAATTIATTASLSTTTGTTVRPGATTNNPPTTQAESTTGMVTPPVIGANFTIKCFECRSFTNNTFYDFCPANGTVIDSMAYIGDCKGPCFTRRDAKDARLVVRGCTATLGTLPNPLPAEGCYDWEGDAFCVCYTPACNRAPIGKSGGVALDEHIINGNTGIIGGPLHCFQCLNYNLDGTLVPQCPKNGRVNVQTVFSGNCSGSCFTRTFSDNSTKVARGCTTTQYGFPEPLPPSGCYDYKGETWCICNTSQCNGGPIGVSSGKELDAHLYEVGNDFVETDGINRCYQCLSYYQNVNYPQCPKNARVRNAYLAPCNGSCITRTYDKDDRIISRACTDYLYGLPNPLPPDGCYTWYTEVWCVCSTSRCNGAALGTPLHIEFDAHIQTRRGSSTALKSNMRLSVVPVFMLMLFLRCYLVI